MDLRKNLVLLFATIFLYSTHLISHSNDLINKPQVKLILMGGFNSCGWYTVDGRSGYEPYTQKAFPYFEELQKELEREFIEYEISTIAMCFSSPIYTPKYIYLRNSKKPMTYAEQIEINSLHNRFNEDISSDDKVFVIGHSYGGWLAMKSNLESFSLQSTRTQLFTIDPISPVDCWLWSYLYGGEGCHRAPTDLDSLGLASSVDYWINFYQRDHSWLNSSAISEANENYHMEYQYLSKTKVLLSQPDTHLILGHGEIHRDTRVWSKILQQIKNSL